MKTNKKDEMQPTFYVSRAKISPLTFVRATEDGERILPEDVKKVEEFVSLYKPAIGRG